MVVDGIGVLVPSLLLWTVRRFGSASEENCQLTSMFADFQGFSELLPDLVASPSSAPVFLFGSFRSDRACSRDRFLTHRDVAPDDTFLPLVAYDTFLLLRCTNPVACVSLVFSFVWRKFC